MNLQCRSVFRQTTRAIILASLCTGVVNVAVAASLSDQWYLGAGYTGSRLVPRAENENVTRIEENGQGATIFFGRDIDYRSSAQIQLYSLGDTVFSDNSIATYTAAETSLLFRFYDSRDNRQNARVGVSIFGRFGFGYLDRDSLIPLNSDGSASVYFGTGGGLEAYFGDTFAIRSEFQYYDRDVASASVSLVARFGGNKRRRGLFGPPGNPTPLPSNNTRVPTQGATLPETTVARVSKPQALPMPTSQGRTQESLNNQRGGIATGLSSNRNDSFNTTNTPNSKLPEVAILGGANENRTPEPAPIKVVVPTTIYSQARNDSDNDGVTDDIDQCSNSNRNYPVQKSNGCSLMKTLASQIKFVENSSNPSPRTEAVLKQLAANMMQFPNSKIELIAHTNATGNSQANSTLTKQRLRTIGIYLVKRGITQDRFLLRSFGGKRPAYKNTTAAGRQANNRIEILENP